MFVNAIAVIVDMGREGRTGSFFCSKSYTRALLYQYERYDVSQHDRYCVGSLLNIKSLHFNK